MLRIKQRSTDFVVLLVGFRWVVCRNLHIQCCVLIVFVQVGSGIPVENMHLGFGIQPHIVENTS